MMTADAYRRIAARWKAETPREAAVRHVTEGRAIVFEQARRVQELKRRGLPSVEAQTLLNSFQRSLEIFEEDLADILIRHESKVPD